MADASGGGTGEYPPPFMMHPALDLVLRQVAENTTNATNSTSTEDPHKEGRPPVFRVVGIILAIASGLFIGVSFVIKKMGLLKANAKYNEEAGEGYGYLKNAWWWLGMALMIVGEICNFAAYAFVDAILVTPMGSLSVVVATVLSAIFLKERLSFVGWVGCFNCIIGSVVIALNAPEESAVATIQEMQDFVIAPGFLSFAGVIIVGCVVIALWAGPRYGKRSMLVYLSICSLIGGLSVVATQGLGAAIIAQAGGTPQFNQWFLYVLLVFVICTLLTEIIYLNKALNIFNAALVTPTYYVFFTSSTIVTSAILFRGFKGTVISITTIILGFLQICSGVILLQLSKSAKDVPDAAVFKGDLDQVRTVAEQEDHVTEPQADAIRGASALLRTISKSRLRKEAEEAKRLQEEWLEPIGENEQVQWDGLRRRKTVLEPGQRPLQRTKTVHYPLGLTHFPDDDSDNETHNPENDHGIFPNWRRRAQTILSRASATHGSVASRSSKNGAGTDTTEVAMTSIPPAAAPGDEVAHLTPFPRYPSVMQYTPPTDLKRSTSIGLSNLQTTDTAYHSQTTTPTHISFAPNPAHHSSTPGPTPPPHADTSPTRTRRQFSFQNVFNPSSPRHNARDDAHLLSPDTPRPTSSSSSGAPHQTTLTERMAASFRRVSGRHNVPASPTEEERLGLVHGDRHTPPRRRAARGRHDDAFLSEAEDDSDRNRPSDDGVDGYMASSLGQIAGRDSSASDSRSASRAAASRRAPYDPPTPGSEEDPDGSVDGRGAREGRAFV